MTANKRVTAETAMPPNTRSREELILEHLPQVELVAKRIHKRLPQSVDLDDLISNGIIGLVAAVDRYDPKQHVKLKTYAEYKIRGAILDSLRVLDWAPRDQRKRGRLIKAATCELEKEHCRTPREEEIAARLGLPLEEYHKWLNETPPTPQSGGDLLRCISDGRSPSELFERAELTRLVAQCIGTLRPIERTVISLYFYQELKLQQIAKVVDLHVSRISQLKGQAISRLKCLLQEIRAFERSVLPSRSENRTVEPRRGNYSLRYPYVGHQ